MLDAQNIYRGFGPPPAPAMPAIGGLYWYIVGKAEGRMVLLGPYSTEGAATQMALRKFPGGTYKVVSSSTRDRAEMTRRIRHEMVEGDSEVGDAIKRMRHRL